MRFLHEIENAKTDEELRKLVEKKIAKLERKSKKHNPTAESIGYQVTHMPKVYEVKWNGDEPTVAFLVRAFYNQFVHKDLKMIYGLSWNPTTGRATNEGCYYYVDNDDYLYDFCRFIKDKEIVDEYEFFGYVRDFLRAYFGFIKMKERDGMYHPLVDKYGEYFEPVLKHSITDFKGQGSALCSEYAVLAQNILRMFDFESYLIVGNVNLNNDTKGDAHAYNLLTFKESDTGELKHAVIDFINSVKVFNYNFEIIGDEPFIGYLDSLDQQFVDKLIKGDLHLHFEEYGYCIIGDTLARITYKDRNRDYFVDKVIRPDDVKKSKINTLIKKPML